MVVHGYTVVRSDSVCSEREYVECRDRRRAECVSGIHLYRRLASPENDCDASEIVYQYVNEPRRGTAMSTSLPTLVCFIICFGEYLISMLATIGRIY